MKKEKKNGRNYKTLDWGKIDDLIKCQCDGAGIAATLGIHPNTLYRRCEEEKNMSYSDYSSIKKAEGKEILRAKQFEIALEGDRTMLVWLGKQYLDQRDKREQNINISEQEKKNREDLLEKIKKIE